MSRFAWLIVPTLLTLLTFLIATPAHAADGVTYVALGDSYTAGLGTPRAAGRCGRSVQAHPQLWAAQHHAHLTSVACSGATTAAVLAHQVSALGSGTDLVSITIGGNDSGFAPTVVICLLASNSVCKAAVRKARTYIADSLPARLDTTYATIRARAPNARIVALTYPRLFDTAGACPGGMSLTKRKALNAAADEVAKVVKASAAVAGAVYADVRAAFAAHGICARTPWINWVSARRPADSFHPTATGQRLGYLPALSAAA